MRTSSLPERCYVVSAADVLPARKGAAANRDRRARRADGNSRRPSNGAAASRAQPMIRSSLIGQIGLALLLQLTGSANHSGE
jgi:hypothetical protein